MKYGHCIFQFQLVYQDMIDKLIEVGRCYGMEMNMEKKQK